MVVGLLCAALHADNVRVHNVPNRHNDLLIQVADIIERNAYRQADINTVRDNISARLHTIADQAASMTAHDSSAGITNVAAVISILVDNLRATPVAQSLHTLADTIESTLAATDLPDDIISFMRHELCDAMTRSVDTYSRYHEPAAYTHIRQGWRGEHVGIGVRLRLTETDGAYIEQVYDDTPARRAGLRAGWYITAIDGVRTAGSNASLVSDLLQGKAGTAVTLEVQLPIGVQRHIELYRQRMRRHTTDTRRIALAGGTAGWIAIRSFAEGTSDAVADFLRRSAGLSLIIVDLRGNGGGVVDEAIAVADMYVTGSTIVSLVYPHTNRRNTYAASSSCMWSGPVVVLVDEHTASAAEIVTAVFKSRPDTIIIGRRTFGKPYMQEVFPAGPHGGAVRITTGYMCGPDGSPLPEAGINSDVFIPDIPHTSAAQACTHILDHLSAWDVHTRNTQRNLR